MGARVAREVAKTERLALLSWALQPARRPRVEQGSDDGEARRRILGIIAKFH